MYLKNDGTPASADEIANFEMELEEWDQKQEWIQHQLFATVPSTILIEIQNLATTADMWNTIIAHFVDRTAIHVVDMKCQLLGLKCRDDAEIPTHLNELIKLPVQLASMGKLIAPAEFCSIIVKSVPESYCLFCTTYLTTAHMTKQAANPNVLIQMIRDEANH